MLCLVEYYIMYELLRIHDIDTITRYLLACAMSHALKIHNYQA